MLSSAVVASLCVGGLVPSGRASPQFSAIPWPKEGSALSRPMGAAFCPQRGNQYGDCVWTRDRRLISLID